MTKLLILLTTFLSALLLFVVQPLFAKYLLPYFGGTPSVWTISVFFYSSVLLAGYVYASIITSVKNNAGYFVHSGLLILTLGLLLERTVNDGSALLGGTQSLATPALSVFGTLVFTLGLPVLLLASTSIVMQYLYARLTEKEPYALYALSNAGSLIGLAVYPFVLEPFTNLQDQVFLWFIGFAAFSVIMVLVWSVLLFIKTKDYVFTELRSVKLQKRWKIVVMAAIPTLLLAAFTEFYARGIASFPFLWVVPLMVYLTSFIIAFRDKPLVQLPFRPELLGAFLTFPLFLLLLKANESIYLFWFSFLFGMVSFFFLATYFHRQIFHLRPRLSDLGNFYVWVTFGGALGSGVVGFLFPYLFNQQHELELALLMLLLFFLYKTRETWKQIDARLRYVPIMMLFFVMCYFGYGILADTSIDRERNFFDILTVMEKQQTVYEEEVTVRTIVSGVTYHGAEVLGAQPTTSISYYGPGSGINTAIRYFNEQDISPAVSVIGLGAGVMNVYCDYVSAISYKEINPAVLEFANEYFTYLELCPEKTEVIIADGRLALESLAENGSETFDIIMMDAFTDDAIPVHLLTREAFEEAYLPLLNDGGIIAFHISNRYLNLYPPIVGNARSLGYEVVAVKAEEVLSPLMNASMWVLVTDAETAEELLQYPATYTYQSEEFIWTDANNSIFQVLHFSDIGGFTF